MIKNINAIIYNRLFASVEYNELDPKPSIWQDVARYWTSSPVIIINNISGRTNKFWCRIETVQFWIWSKTKAGITPIRNCIAEVFNRWKWNWIDYSWELNSKALYDDDTKEYGLAMDFVFKAIDNEY